MSAKDDALDIAEKLSAAHAAHPNSPELDALHASLDAGLDNNAKNLKLSATDVDDIRGVHPANGGGPKNPPQ